MNSAATLVVPPAPPVHHKPLSTWRGVAALLRDPLTLYSEQDFEGSFRRTRFLGRHNIGLNDPAAVRHVLGASPARYRRPVASVRPFRWMLGNGLFLAEGEPWRQQRRMLAPVFSPAHVGELLPHFHAAGAAMLERLEGCAEVNLAVNFTEATLDALLRALFSIPAATQGSELSGLVRRYLSGPGRPRLSDGLARTEEDFGFLNGARRRFRDRWLATVDAIVEARRGAPPSGASRDLLDVLLAARDPETGAPLSTEDVRDQSATMLFAGFETTTRLLFWASYLLSLDRSEQTSIRSEIAAFPPERVTSLDDLDNWPGLRRTLLEALRLYPPVPLLVREAMEADEVLGVAVAPGDFVWMSPWTLHRHRRHWEHPTAFMPDRFADQAHPWTQGAFMPFGGGPRICIGASFAMAEAQVLLATLLERYQMGVIGSRPVIPVGAVTTIPNYEPLFSLRRSGG